MVRELRALHEAGELNEDQQRWFEPVGEERLFDTEADPHELRDLAGDPARADVLARMRAALDAWLARTPDWSETPEADMVAQLTEQAGEPGSVTQERIRELQKYITPPQPPAEQ